MEAIIAIDDVTARLHNAISQWPTFETVLPSIGCTVIKPRQTFDSVAKFDRTGIHEMMTQQQDKMAK
ncbi:hypothetical protein TNCV_2421851 [Trichonephila clavipes]|nr:hypothetical protein TNCV_2421851 [Trichonephila clavipes]